jgi:glycosyltransferase involved in cell wall biosynthesis
MKKLCYVATIPAAVHAFLRGYILASAEKYDVTVVCNSVEVDMLDGLNAHLILLPIERKPSPWKDMLVLFQLCKLFRREQFDIVHSIMPKTGMIAMLAALLVRVPTRIHTFTGQVWVTKHGVRRILLKWFDKMIGRFALCVLVDSPSQRDFLVDESVVPFGKTKVIGAGSICGVDSARFHPDQDARSSVRHDLGIFQDAPVILFVGRLNCDKGMLDLAWAFSAIAKINKDVVLLLVGSEEDVPFSRIQEICGTHSERLRYVSFTSTPEDYMAAADIFCLPSYREGFGMTIIEAAACAVPAVASRIYGITDAVVDGKTGLLIPCGDVAALTQALLKLILEDNLRQQMGNAARVRALELFSATYFTREMVNLYDRLSEGGLSENDKEVN